ncbi:hypothetical protein C8Q79DRAFT_973986 [Trametes meyenii]|nr:hypothetical protein C8Q79DRAFT_973986 [Trametes meyenii]
MLAMAAHCTRPGTHDAACSLKFGNGLRAPHHSQWRRCNFLGPGHCHGDQNSYTDCHAEIATTTLRYAQALR